VNTTLFATNASLLHTTLLFSCYFFHALFTFYFAHYFTDYVTHCFNLKNVSTYVQVDLKSVHKSSKQSGTCHANSGACVCAHTQTPLSCTPLHLPWPLSLFSSPPVLPRLSLSPSRPPLPPPLHLPTAFSCFRGDSHALSAAFAPLSGGRADGEEGVMEALRSSLREMEVCLSCALLVCLSVYSRLYRYILCVCVCIHIVLFCLFSWHSR
jgi:hypothetical protein